MSAAGEDTNMENSNTSKDGVTTEALNELLAILTNGKASVSEVVNAQNSPLSASETLKKWVDTGVVRDAEFTAETYTGLQHFLHAGLTSSNETFQQNAIAVFSRIIRVPEFDNSNDAAIPKDELLQQLFQKLKTAQGTTHAESLKRILYWAYNNFPERRSSLRTHFGKFLREFTLVPDGSTAVSPVLDVLANIIDGFPDTFSEVHLGLLHEILLPLHQVGAKVSGRGGAPVPLTVAPGGRAVVDGQPLLATYHASLVKCEICFCSRNRSLATSVIRFLFANWPRPNAGVSQMEVLLLHQVEKYLEYVTEDEFADLFPELLQRLSLCISCEFAQISQRALQFWKNEAFTKRTIPHLDQLFAIIIPACYRGRKPHWNMTVNRLSGTVLDILRKQDEVKFQQFCNQLIKLPLVKTSLEVEDPQGNVNPTKDSITEKTKENQSMDVGGGMGEISEESIVIGAPSSNPKAATTSSVPKYAAGVRMGVHPSAMAQQSAASADPKDSSEKKSLVVDQEHPKDGFTAVLAFIEKYKADAQIHFETMDSMTVTPTLLPTLKFHELVFGRELGSGAFSIVKYAKQIIKGVPFAQWPEFAVKTISIEKIKKLGYEASVAREIAILKVASHPSIARLITSFRWREGAYLVLEYGAHGDLHSFIQSEGSLNIESTRFVTGEVLAGLQSLHSKGFVFGDLKPENVVITNSGHAKITDFGAARAVNDAAKKYLQDERNAISNLRDGDYAWRSAEKEKENATDNLDKKEEIEADQKESKDGESEEGPSEAVEDDDTRIEGTAVYLAPEVAKGEQPTLAADYWAFGCLIYQCLAGRPPIWAETMVETVQAIVSFAPTADKFPDYFPGHAIDLVTSLLNAEKNERQNLSGAALHPFFEGVDVYSLYEKEAPEMVRGAAAPAPDAQWARRQISMLWQPMPDDFKQLAVPTHEAILETELEANVPFVGSIKPISETKP
eukprot:m.94804 g.94804  ORF g.94804 m.94804 type:complete len:958 (+) comp13459_c0_seq1:122-2995(+)